MPYPSQTIRHFIDAVNEKEYLRAAEQFAPRARMYIEANARSNGYTSVEIYMLLFKVLSTEKKMDKIKIERIVDEADEHLNWEPEAKDGGKQNKIKSGKKYRTSIVWTSP